jgi:hypothetical protein
VPREALCFEKRSTTAQAQFSGCPDRRRCSSILRLAMRSPRLLHTQIGWSRWVFGVWAIATAVWLFVATLMLVHWPETVARPFEGQTYVRAIPVVGEHATKFLLFAAIPPAFRFVLCCAGLWIAGLPFPYSRQDRAVRSRGSK